MSMKNLIIEKLNYHNVKFDVIDNSFIDGITINKTVNIFFGDILRIETKECEYIVGTTTINLVDFSSVNNFTAMRLYTKNSCIKLKLKN